MQPTLITNVTNDMRVAQEEIFGPVAVVIKFKTEEEVIAMANDCVYGLGGAVWTRDLNRAIRVSRGVETGRMWVNTYNADPRRRSLRRLQALRYRSGNPQGHPVPLHPAEKHYDQLRGDPLGVLSRPVRAAAISDGSA